MKPFIPLRWRRARGRRRTQLADPLGHDGHLVLQLLPVNTTQSTVSAATRPSRCCQSITVRSGYVTSPCPTASPSCCGTPPSPGGPGSASCAPPAGRSANTIQSITFGPMRRYKDKFLLIDMEFHLGSHADVLASLVFRFGHFVSGITKTRATD